MRVKTILLLIFAVIVTILTALISHNKQYGKGDILVDTAIFVSSRTMVPPEFLLAVLQEATEPDATPPYQTHEDEEIYLWVENQLFENQLFNVSSKHPYFNKRSFLQPQFTGNKPRITKHGIIVRHRAVKDETDRLGKGEWSNKEIEWVDLQFAIRYSEKNAGFSGVRT